MLRDLRLENISIYTMKEYADIFMSENNLNGDTDCTDEMVESFMDFLSVDEQKVI